MTLTPPEGVPPLLWLVVFLLVGPPALMSKVGAKLPWVFGAAGRWWQGRTSSTASYRISQEELARVVADYERIREDYDEMVAWKATMETELTTANRRFWAAVAYIRRLVDFGNRHAPDADMPPLPELLRDIV
ncbi:hypothetical protein FZI85_25255 [Mycobacterium sp. CBMA293]|uniref:hypothetical protein n=1 Tax=unclassified Mycolicibacterium TaxID=2636767 RepID=UPI0012DE258C|nr:MULTISPECIES: hypothetical protein [unclassified Mycolicibacterium]MUL47623.1 hypothetical protein [Mycolicibacterium sp. CBMA 360]MUL61859.1 hypothetical protein [Mycolicibacterium sp. CBMA 335]MUL68932.1 hypothetical protein [Mycolicibacterium sp. CBMA 311]MUL92851.1 hypothetical protein [Mycolicibacterium sp. CBMA 230]MUM08706.1 hypothetical protein [Mycolicibacterium sp. CBMA 213]